MLSNHHLFMRNLKTFIIGMSAVAVLATGTIAAQRKAASARAPKLTALDYIEIQQLVARYGYAVDTGADNGYMYADLFASDGVFLDRAGNATTGREGLAALGRRFQRGPQSTFHFLVNHVIEPTANGAIGREYLVQLRIREPDRPNGIFGGGRYQDVYEQTPTGWRFKSRQFIPSEDPGPAASDGNRK